MNKKNLFIAVLLTVIAGVTLSTLPKRLIAEEVNAVYYERINIIGETANKGVFDPARPQSKGAV